jgi:hypothetical protein
MSESESVVLIVPTQDIDDVVAAFGSYVQPADGGPSVPLPVVTINRLESAGPELAAMLLAGAALARAVTPMVVAYLNAKRARHVRVVAADGSSIDVDGTYSADDVMEIMELAVVSHPPAELEPGRE